MKVVNLETNHRYAVVVQDLATQWIQSCPCKFFTSENGKELAKILGADAETKSQLLTQTISQNLANLVGIFPGIIVRQRHTDQKQMVLLRGRYAGTSAVLLQSGLDVKWRIPWSVTAISVTSKISRLLGRHLVNGESANNHLMDP